MKDLEKKAKKAPDDIKAKMTEFLAEAHRGLDELSGSLKSIEKKTKEIAEYFCEDAKKFKIENLLSELLAFVSGFEAAVEVGVVCGLCGCGLCVYADIYRIVAVVVSATLPPPNKVIITVTFPHLIKHIPLVALGQTPSLINTMVLLQTPFTY